VKVAEPVPSVGKIVHYRQGGACVAAIVLAVDSPTVVMLHVFPAQGTDGRVWRVGFDPSAEVDGAWHWPARV
jgi:hypothetical protein